jgi:hypothetical protein
MLSVDSHYLNDPLPKNIVLSPEEKARILGGGCYVERTCGAFEHRFKNMAQNCRSRKIMVK